MATFRQNRVSRRTTTYAGAVTGLVAGLMMAILGMSVAEVTGEGFWTPTFAIAAVFWGVSAMVSGPGVAVAGILIHLVVSAGFGALFAFVARNLNSVVATLLGGIAYGVTVWAIMNFLVVPVVNPTMSARMGMMPGWWFFHHVVYGASLCTLPIFREMFAAGAGESRETALDSERPTRAA